MESEILKFGKETFVGRTKGSLLDDYEVVKQLGEGGFGKVYEVKNNKTKELRACKQLSKLNIKNLEKFQREIDFLVKTDHPNIVKLYEVYESTHSLYLIMEECNGGELFDKIVDHIENFEMYTEKESSEILLQIMSAIEYCHNNGICHRDLKPENLLYLNKGDEKDNPIKVIDFGLGQYIKNDKKLKTKVGSAYYVAPEVLKGEYSEKCDVWSAGIILYVLLSGDPPFNGPNDKIIYSKILKMNYSFPEKKWKTISEEAKDLINHMLKPENERYSAEEVLAHPWFNYAKNNIEKKVSVEKSFFKEYKKFALLKKMILTFIASRLKDNEIKELKELFQTFDLKHDGQISFSELKESLKKLNSENIDENEIESIFQAIDTDKNNKIDYTEFLAATLEKKLYLKEERLFEAFSVFDKDNSGKITKEKILEVLNLEPEFNDTVEELIKMVDKNGDGIIDYREFLELMEYKENKLN